MANLTDREFAELVRMAEEGGTTGPPTTRRAKKTARKNFKKMRMGFRREEKREKGLTRSQIDKARNENK